MKDNVSSSWSLGLTQSGTLYVWKRAGAVFVKVAAADMARKTLVDAPVGVFERFVESRGRPDWSADGRHLAFVSCGPFGGGPCAITVWDTETGRARDVPAGLQYVQFPRLSPDGRRIATNGRDSKGRRGLQIIIDVDTGRKTLLEGIGGGVLDWSSDGQSLYLLRSNNSHHTIVQHEVASGREREVFRALRAGIDGSNLRISPDGSMVGTIAESGRHLVVTSTAGGEGRVVFRAVAPQSIHWQVSTGTADSKQIVVKKGAMPSRAD